jgi:hypothetical protein
VIEVKLIGLNSDKKFQVYVHWDVAGVVFEVYRSTAPHHDFELLASTNVPFHVDETANMYDSGNKFYYRVVGKNGAGTVMETSETAEIRHNNRDLIAGKVIKEMRVVLRIMRNPRSYLLIARREGDDCPNCFNSVTKRVMFADCPVCFGTGKRRGYFPPVPIRMSTDMSQFVDDGSYLSNDKVALTPVDAWVENYPKITPGDVIVDVTDRRFLVMVVIPRTKSQYVIRQIIQMTPLEKGHPAFGVVVNHGEGNT